VIVFLLEPGLPQSTSSNIFVIIALIALGYWYFILAPLNYGIAPSKTHRRIVGLLGVLITVGLAILFYTPSFLRFFELQRPSFYGNSVNAWRGMGVRFTAVSYCDKLVLSPVDAKGNVRQFCYK